MKKHVIIVAGGSGSRMRQSLPKQFIKILGKPLVVHTIEAFSAYDPSISVVVVLPEHHLSVWEEIYEEFLRDTDVVVALGGDSRFQSVKSGLHMIDSGLVAIHDAVRPLITTAIIADSFRIAEEHGSGVVMVPLKDSIRQINAAGSQAVDRSKYQVVQTPQTFQVELIKKAFQRKEQDSFTDDASVYESSGMMVQPVAGSYENIKVTTPEDLVVVKALMQKKEMKGT